MPLRQKQIKMEAGPIWEPLVAHDQNRGCGVITYRKVEAVR